VFIVVSLGVLPGCRLGHFSGCFSGCYRGVTRGVNRGVTGGVSGFILGLLLGVLLGVPPGCHWWGFRAATFGVTWSSVILLPVCDKFALLFVGLPCM